MSEEERFSSQDLLDTSASDIWVTININSVEIPNREEKVIN